MSTTLLDGVVKKNRARLIPFMLALYVLLVPVMDWLGGAVQEESFGAQDIMTQAPSGAEIAGG